MGVFTPFWFDIRWHPSISVVMAWVLGESRGYHVYGDQNSHSFFLLLELHAQFAEAGWSEHVGHIVVSGTMDYLSKLPIEIWRTIIGLIPTDGAPGGFMSTAPLHFLDVKQYPQEAAKDSQVYKASLLTICKALKPIVEEWLYREVVLSHENMKGAKYLAGACILQSNGRRCGEWTRTVWIYDIPFLVSFAFACGSSFQYAYPNLETIHSIGWTYTPNLHRSVTESSWNATGLEGITTLTLDHIGLLPYHLRLVATTFPHLTGLSLLSAGEEAYDEPVHFPSLTRLFLSWAVVSTFPLDKLDMPNLKWLSIEIGTVEGLEYADAFMRRYGPNLIGLQVSTDAFLWLNPTLPAGLFDLCQNLEVLGIQISKMDALVRSAHATTDAHIRLRHLILTFQCPIETQQVQNHAAYFSKQAFPALERVTMAAEGPNIHMDSPVSLGLSHRPGIQRPLHTPSLVHEAAIASFPHAFVELVVQQC